MIVDRRPFRRQSPCEIRWWTKTVRPLFALLAVALHFGTSDVAIAQNASIAANETTSVGSPLIHSAVPIRNREAEARLKQAAVAIDAAEKLRLLREVLEDDDATGVVDSETLIPGIQTQVDLKVASRRALFALPPDERRFYREQVAGRSESALRRRLAGNSKHDLIDIYRRYPLSDAGLRALRMSAVENLDRGQHEIAADKLSEALRHPDLSEPDRKLVTQQLRFVLESIANNARSEASGLQVSLRTLDDPQRISRWIPQIVPTAGWPLWQADSGLDHEMLTVVQHSLKEHSDHSIPLLPQAAPLVIGEAVVFRTVSRLVAFNLATADVLWDVSLESTTGQAMTRFSMNSSLQHLAGRNLAKRLQLDSVYSHMTTDGTLLFTTELAGRKNAMLQPGASDPFDRSRTNDPSERNQIVARNVKTGEVEWKTSADSVLPEALETFILGSPTVHGESVFCIVQGDERVLLIVLDRLTGRRQWATEIATTERDGFADADWRLTACPVVVKAGVVICPTGAGLITGVDAELRKPVWSVRYERDDVPPTIPRLPGGAVQQQRYWWSNWRRISLLPHPPIGVSESNDESATPQNTIFYIGPDRHGVLAIDAATGAVLWKSHTPSPLYVAGVFAGRAENSSSSALILVERHNAMALDAATGEKLWRTEIREPAGRGYTATPGGAEESLLVVPIRRGGFAAIRITDGHCEYLDGAQHELGVTLTASQNRIVSQSLEHLAVHTTLADTITRLQKSPTMDQIRLAGIEHVGGEHDRSRQRLQQILEDSPELRARAAQELLSADIERLDRITNRGMLETAISDLSESPSRDDVESQIEILQKGAEVAQRIGAHELSMRLMLNLLELNPAGEIEGLQTGPRRVVRYDRYIVGRMLDVLPAADSEARNGLRAVFDERIRSVTDSRDPFAVQRFASRLQGFPWAAKPALRSDARIGQTFTQTQSNLLSLAGNADPRIAFEATESLIDLYESRSYAFDAAALKLRLIENDHNSTPDKAKSLLKTLQTSEWPDGAPKVTERSERFVESNWMILPVECQSGTLFQRLNVSITPGTQRNGTVVRFFGDGNSGYWDLRLPRSRSPFRAVWTLPKAWGLGHFVVLRLGADLFGITPYDTNGEPRARLHWTVETAEESRLVSHRFDAGVAGFREADLLFLDAFDRAVAQVGPVRPGYLCYRTKGRLVCLDPATGRRLWERSEWPRNADCVGDDSSVIIVERDTGRITVLRSADGKTIATHILPHLAPDAGSMQMLRTNGVQALFGNADNPDRPMEYASVERVHLGDGTTQWSAKPKPGAVVFAIGRRWIGMLDTDGHLQVHDWTTGQLVSKFQVDRPQDLKTVHCASDMRSHVLGMSSVAEPAFQQAGQIRGGYRLPRIQGTMITIDAFTGDFLWQAPVPGWQFPIDQPKDVPFLTLTSRRISGEGESAENRLHLVDRRTGRVLFSRGGLPARQLFGIEPFAGQSRAVIRLPRSSIRLEYQNVSDSRK